MLEDAAEMEVNFSLEPRGVQAGFVLTCQTRPTGPRVVIDSDRM